LFLTKCAGAVTTAAEVDATFSAVRHPAATSASTKASAASRIIVRCYQRAADAQLLATLKSDSNAEIASSVVDHAHIKR